MPSDVDEAEFEVSVDGPRGHEPGRDGRGHAARRAARCARCPACALVLATVGRQLPRRGQPGASSTCASRPTRSATFSWSRLIGGHRHGSIRWRRSAATTSQRDVMQQSGGRIRKFPDLRDRGPQHRRPSTSAAARSTSTSPCAGPSSTALAEYTEELRLKAPGARASSTPTPRSSSNKPELRVQIDRERAADLGVDTAGHRHRAAPHGGRRRRGLALSATRRSTRTTTCSCGWPRRDRDDPRRIGQPARAAARTATLVRLDNLVTIDAGRAAPRASTASTGSARRACARSVGARLRARPTASRRCAGGRRRLNLPPATASRSPGAARSWRRPSPSSSGRSCSRSSSCT